MKAKKRRKRRAHHEEAAAPGRERPFASAWVHKLNRLVLPVVVFFWPFLYLFRHVVPIEGQYTAIGNDFINLYYKYKVYLLAHLANFSFPLWSPSEAAGFPFYSNPFAQAFYPFNLLLAAWYRLSGGYNPLDHQVFTVLGISIFALGLFMWLRLLNKNIRAVLFAVLVMSVSFKVTEIIRFPNAVHTAAWYPWVLYALTRIMSSTSLKNAVLHGVLLTFFLICLCTGGYPYYAYYCQFLLVPYFAVFTIRPLRVWLTGVQNVAWRHSLGTLTAAGAATLLICGRYLVAIRQLMSETIDRAGKDFNYSTAHVFNLNDTLGSLVYPPAACTEGWYFFSITALLIILIYIFSGGAARLTGGKREINGDTNSPHNLLTKLFFLVWIAAITYITYGKSSCLFLFLWKFMPGFSSLRVWGRLNIILVPILAWVLSLGYHWFESAVAGNHPVDKAKRSLLRSPITAALAAYAIILCAQLYLHLNGIQDPYWVLYFKDLSPHGILFIWYGLIGALFLLFFMIFGKRIRLGSARSLAVMLVILVGIGFMEMRHTAVHIWAHKEQASKERVHLDVGGINTASFHCARSDANDSITLGPAFRVGILENWYFNRYVQFLKNTEDEPEARKVLLGVRDGTKIFFSESIQHLTVESFLQDAARYGAATGRLVSYNGDELDWEIEAPTAGYLSFIDNWDRDWKARVDGATVEIELLFGTFKSVRLGPGRHRVRFHYQPALFLW